MSLRTKWEFSYDKTEVIQAATAKVEHHRERLEFWTAEAKRAEEDLREHGIELREHAVSGGYNLQPMFDPEKMKRLNECKVKIDEHRHMAEEFETYVRAFSCSLAERIPLDVDDVKFFGL